jgi:hypothetical protein
MLAMTLSGAWVVLVALVPVIGLLVAVRQLRLATLAQLRAAQPVIVVHETSYSISNRGDVEFRVYLENLGVSTAFNVRFGVSLDGTRYPFTAETTVEGDTSGEIGARQVVPAGQRVPDDGSFVIRMGPMTAYAGRKPGVGERRVYWATYENPHGETWEDHEPGGPESRHPDPAPSMVA